MAFLSLGVPSTAVYFVSPLLIASIAASLMLFDSNPSSDLSWVKIESFRLYTKSPSPWVEINALLYSAPKVILFIDFEVILLLLIVSIEKIVGSESMLWLNTWSPVSIFEIHKLLPTNSISENPLGNLF